MNLALAAYENRIASLLETANRMVVVNLNDSRSKRIVAIANQPFPCLVQLLHDNNIAILICGAINGCTFRIIEASGIQVIPWITGNVDDILAAFENNTLESCLMPGCTRGCRYGRHGRRGWTRHSR